MCSMTLDSGRALSCNGTCSSIFHFTCVGLTKTQYASLTAKLGMFWFCNSCRLNFEPAVYDRERTIMKALRELLIRTDSMDTRLGNYGENLRKINKTLYDSQVSKPADSSSFAKRIEQLTLDDSSDDPINRSSIGCCKLLDCAAAGKVCSRKQ